MPGSSWRPAGDSARRSGFYGSLDTFYAKIQRRHTMGLQPIVVVVDDGNGYRSMYVHLAKARSRSATTSSPARSSAYEGDTGNASGCHVHYELVRMDGPWMRVAGQLVKEYGYPDLGARAGRPAPGAEPEGQAGRPVRARAAPPEAAAEPPAAALVTRLRTVCGVCP